MNLTKELEKLYPSKFPKFISNSEIERFLEERRSLIKKKDFFELKEFFLVKKKLNRSVFETWENENKSIFSPNKILQK